MRRREFLALAGAARLAGAAVPTAKMAADPQRPQCHLMPAANWMNDPNGPIYWHGNYHMFYQYNPNGAFWGDMHWGHAVSEDMLHWKHLPMALAPTPGGCDKDGVFSGCAVIDNGVPTMVYTSVNPETQSIATSNSSDLLDWKKYEGNPVIAGPPPGLEVTGFRDPAVWQEDGMWRMALGSGFRGKGGAVLLYESKDLRHWKYVHPLVTGKMKPGPAAKDPVDSGEMWECPDFFPLGGKHVLIISTERVVKYMVGRYADRKFEPETEGALDFGCYYAARTTTNTGNRRILWGWITEGRTVDAQKAAGWSGAMSLPRVLMLGPDNRLRFRPAAEVDRLHGSPLGAEPRGSCLELRATIDAGNAAQAGLKLRVSPDEREQTLLYYDRGLKTLAVDRAKSSLDGSADRGIQSVPFELGAGEPLQLRVFLDGSVVEIFANEKACLTARIYPTLAESQGIGLYSSGGKARMVAMESWALRPISSDRLTS